MKLSHLSLFLSTLVALSSLGHAAQITIDNLSDDISSAKGCNIRQALAAADSDVTVADCAAGNGADTIIFANNLIGISGIALDHGSLEVGSDVAIDASTAAGGIVPIDGLKSDTVLTINSGHAR